MNASLSRFLSVFTLLSRRPRAEELRARLLAGRLPHPRPLAPRLPRRPGRGGPLSSFLFNDALLAALGALAFQYLAFNLFHLDGLLDSADAMGVYAEPERRFAILKDSRIGSYAFFAGFLLLSTKLALLSLIFKEGLAPALLALLAAPLAGPPRLRPHPPLASVPAKSEGLGALMRDFSGLRLVTGSLLGLLPLAIAVGFSGRLGPGRGRPWAPSSSAALSAASGSLASTTRSWAASPATPSAPPSRWASWSPSP